MDRISGPLTPGIAFSNDEYGRRIVLKAGDEVGAFVYISDSRGMVACESGRVLRASYKGNMIMRGGRDSGSLLFIDCNDLSLPGESLRPGVELNLWQGAHLWFHCQLVRQCLIEKKTQAQLLEISRGGNLYCFDSKNAVVKIAHSKEGSLGMAAVSANEVAENIVLYFNGLPTGRRTCRARDWSYHILDDLGFRRFASRLYAATD